MRRINIMFRAEIIIRHSLFRASLCEQLAKGHRRSTLGAFFLVAGPYIVYFFLKPLRIGRIHGVIILILRRFRFSQLQHLRLKYRVAVKRHIGKPCFARYLHFPAAVVCKAHRFFIRIAVVFQCLEHGAFIIHRNHSAPEGHILRYQFIHPFRGLFVKPYRHWKIAYGQFRKYFQYHAGYGVAYIPSAFINPAQYDVLIVLSIAGAAEGKIYPLAPLYHEMRQLFLCLLHIRTPVLKVFAKIRPQIFIHSAKTRPICAQAGKSKGKP